MKKAFFGVLFAMFACVFASCGNATSTEAEVADSTVVDSVEVVDSLVADSVAEGMVVADSVEVAE